MWWNKIIFGWEAYHVVLWFLTYSILGWMIESVYMSICNRKLTNRGFIKGPICPIYGIGALTVFFMLSPYSQNPIRLFFMGMLLATAIEFLTAVVMQRIFGSIWWDYRRKPFNYRGIICLESSIAWGFYTIALFLFLHRFVVSIVDSIPVMWGRVGGSVLLFIFLLDFLTSFYKEKKDDLPDKVMEVRDMLLERFGRG